MQIYIMDIHIFYTLLSALIGGVMGARARLGEVIFFEGSLICSIVYFFMDMKTTAFLFDFLFLIYLQFLLAFVPLLIEPNYTFVPNFSISVADTFN